MSLRLHHVTFTPAGEREFRNISHDLQQRITKKLRLYLSTNNPLTFAKPLVNLPPATHRFRMGKYRVCFDLDGSSLVIDGVDTREDAYRRK